MHLEEYRWKYDWFRNPHGELSAFIKDPRNIETVWEKFRPRILAGEEERLNEELMLLQQE